MATTGGRGRDPRRGKRGRGWAAAVETVVVVAVGSGCARDAHLDLDPRPPGFAATPGYVAEVVDAADAEAYRYSMTVAVSVAGDGISGEFATGSIDGDESHVRLDPGAMMSPTPERDLSWELITTDEAMYVHDPGATVTGGDPTDEGPSDPEGMVAAFAGLEGDWGRIDLGRLGGVTPRQMEETVNKDRRGDPRALLELLRETEVVHDLGSDVVDGVAVTGLTGDVDLRAMLDVVAMGGIPEDVTGLSLDMANLTFPLEMWVDGDGRVLRIGFAFAGDALDRLAEANDADVPPHATGLEIAMTTDLFDHGDSSIRIEAPDEDETVDATEALLAAYHHEHGSTPDAPEPTTTTSSTTTTPPTTASPTTTTWPPEDAFFATDFGSDQDWGPVEAPFSYQSGRFVIHAGADDGATSYAPSPPFPTTGNFRIDVDVEKLGTDPAAAVYGIECSTDPDGDSVEAHQATIDTDGSWAVRWANGTPPDRLDQGVFLDGVDAVIRSEGPNHITLEVRNNGRDVRFRFLVNRQELTTIVEQPDHACDHVGLMAEAPPGSSGVDIAFDNLAVTNL